VELKAYLHILRARWWVIVATVAVAGLGAAALVMPRPSIYESAGTMLIRPIAGSESDAIDASDLLIRGVKIGSTYATVARSDLIRKRAEAVVDPSVDTSGVDVEAELVTDTNIVEITVRGTDPDAAQALAVAIQEEMAAYVASVDDTYALVPLDEPKLPKRPVAPNKILTIAIGMVLGLFAGLGLVLMEQYVRGPGESGVAHVIDPRTGLHNELYLRERLRQETERARRTGHGFSLVTMRAAIAGSEDGVVVSAPSRRDLRRIGEALKASTLPEAVLAYLGGSTFAAILPDVPSEEAEELRQEWESAAAASFGRIGEGPVSRLHVSTAACHYRDGRFTGDREALRVASFYLEDTEGSVTDEELASPPRPVDAPLVRLSAADGSADGQKDPSRPAAVAADPVGAVQDPHGDPRRRRAGWKGSGRAGDRAG
jgi:capsular polysaccharide biosynthesis protein